MFRADIVITSKPKRQMWRVLHDSEMGANWRIGFPEVFILQEHAIPMTKEWQEFSFALNKLEWKRWRALHGYTVAFCNGTGFDDPNDPRADHIGKVDLEYELPKWDKARVCGGAVVTGTVDGADLILDTLDGSKPPPPLDIIIPQYWLYYRAIWIRSDGTYADFEQGRGVPCLMPLVTWGTGVRYPLSKLIRV